jgi:hypothetical protein
VASSPPRPSIARLLIDLADNKDGVFDRWRASDEAQDAIVEEYGLSEGQKRILFSGDLRKIQNAVFYEFAQGDVDELPDFGEDGQQGARQMVVTWRPMPRPTWGTPES